MVDTTRMMTLIPHEYANRKLQAGDDFEAEDAHLVLLMGLGRCRHLTDEERAKLFGEPPKTMVVRSDMVAEGSGAREDSDETGAGTITTPKLNQSQPTKYKRRDLRTRGGEK